MTKRAIALLMLVLVIGMVGCGKKKSPEAVPTTAPVTPEAAAPATMAPTPTPTVEPTEEPIPGVEDSIFDQLPPEKEEVQKPDGGEVPDETLPPESEQPAAPDYTLTEYEKYQQLSPTEQKAYMDSFGSIDAFFDWYNTVKEAHEAQKPPISVGDGSIDMSEIAGTNNG